MTNNRLLLKSINKDYNIYLFSITNNNWKKKIEEKNNIYMLLEIFPVSPRGFESFTRRFGSLFGAIFKRGGGRSTWS